MALRGDGLPGLRGRVQVLQFEIVRGTA